MFAVVLAIAGMRMWRIAPAIAVAGLAAALIIFPVGLRPGRVVPRLSVPFDFSRQEIALSVTVGGTPLTMLLDTGVDPSVIDIAKAKALGMKIDFHAGGETSGEGNSKENSIAYPTTIRGLSIAGHAFPPVEALTADMSPLSRGYGKPIDGALGFSFLKDKTILIDYPSRTLSFFDRRGDAEADIRTCRTHWSAPIRFLPDNNTPVIPMFRFGKETVPITLDTGSNGNISLYSGALALPEVKRALVANGTAHSEGFRGSTVAKTYVLNLPIGFGPFTLQAGQIVRLRDTVGSRTTRLANIGNRIYAAMNLKMLLDYRAGQMSFYGDCH